MTLLHETEQGLAQATDNQPANPLTEAYYRDVSDYQAELGMLLATEPYISGFQDAVDGVVKSFSIFVTEASSPLSNPAKALDATIRKNDKNWDDTRDVTAESLGPLQENSFYFTYIDTTDPESPKVQGILMVADATKGASETISYFSKENPGQELPDAFAPKVGKHLWDIVGIMVPKEVRDTSISIRIEHALYKLACEISGQELSGSQPEEEMIWISSISASELRNLREYLGIPFEPIKGVEPTEAKGVRYDFCSLNVQDIARSMTENITELEADINDFNRFVSGLARIALLGTNDRDIADINRSILDKPQAA